MRTAGLTISIVVAVLVGHGVAATAYDSDGDGLRDFFERKWGVTSPRLADSDGDGVIDSAEDGDDDRLSNLGEQRFGLDPRSTDSDGDGKSDGAEDHDRNGVSNAYDQDRRRVPGRLVPSLSRATVADSERWPLCRTPVRPNWVVKCAFGDVTSRTTVALFGDSHAAHWIPALDRAGQRSDWKGLKLTRPACPSVSILTRGQLRLDMGASCRRWRGRALEWLRNHPPDVIIISNLGTYTTYTDAGSLIPAADRPAAWKQALAETLAALPSTSRVVLLADTPRMARDPVECLRRHRRNMARCTTSRTRAMASPIRQVEREAAADAGVPVIDLNGRICSYDPCPLVQGNVLVWRDQGHITRAFSRRLWPSMRAELQRAAGRALVPAGRR